MKKYIFIAFACLFGNATIQAQDKVETTVEADVVSQYIWRGMDLGHVSLQPTLAVSYKGLTLEAWGSVGLTDSNDTREFDVTRVLTRRTAISVTMHTLPIMCSRLT